MKSVLIRLEHYQPGASVAEKGLVDYILSAPEAAADSDIHQLSRMSYCSPSTIVRLCRKLGFDGYRDMRKQLSCELAVRRRNTEQRARQLEPAGRLEDVIRQTTYGSIASLEESMQLIEPDTLAKCVELLAGCDTVLLFGLGASWLVAQDAYLKFLRIGKRSACCGDIHSQYLLARSAKSTDAAIIVSYSGCTEEMIRCARDLQAQGTPIIAVTRFRHSPLEQLAAYCLYVADMEELFRSGAMGSRIAQLNAVDILYTAYVNQDFARNVDRLERSQLTKPVPDRPPANV